MAGFFDDFVEALKFSFSWLKEGKMWLYALAILILSIPSMALSLSILFPFPAFLTSIPVLVISTLIIAYLSLLITLQALKARSLPTLKSIGIMEILKYIAVMILTVIYATFSIKNLKLLLIPAVSVVLLIIGLSMSGIGKFALAGLAILGFIAYGFVLIYNYLRLGFSVLFYLGEIGIVESIENSWNLTQGKVLRLLGFYFLLGVVVFFPLMILRLLLIGYLLSPITNIASSFFIVAIFSQFLSASGIVFPKKAVSPRKAVSSKKTETTKPKRKIIR